jgi:uncharacterized membrane protein
VPIGGALIYVPADWIKPADGGVERLMNVYVSIGRHAARVEAQVAMPPPPMPSAAMPALAGARIAQSPEVKRVAPRKPKAPKPPKPPSGSDGA